MDTVEKYSNDNPELVLNLVEEQEIKYNAQKDFTTLEAWRKARLLMIFFYKEVIPHLPPAEKFNLEIQIRKAAVSARGNISEGYGRYHYQETIQFCRISRGSIFELKDHLISCLDLSYINKDVCTKGITLIEEAKITLNGYINYVNEQKELMK